MTKDEFINEMDACDDPEACWQLLVDFVAGWIDEQRIEPWDRKILVDSWREEMA